MATLTTSYQLIGTGNATQVGQANGYLELYAKYNSQSTVNNQTNYTVELRLVVTKGYFGNYQSTPYSVASTGLTTVNGDIGSGSHTSRVLGSTTGTVTHNNDGTKSISASGTLNLSAWGITLSVSGSATLPTINRQATLTSAENFYIDGNPKITYTNPAGNNVDTLQACISLTGQRDDVPYRNISKIGTEYIFTLTDTERQTLINACTGSSLSVIFFVATTISGTTYYSTLTRTMTLVKATLTSAEDFYIDGNPKITYTNPSKSGNSSLQVCISWTGADDIGYRDVSKTGTEYTFNFTDSERQKIINACSKQDLSITYYLRSKIGGSYEYSTSTKKVKYVSASQPSLITWPNTTTNIGAIGTEITVHMNRNSSSFKHKVRYSFGNLSGNIAENIIDNCRWVIPTGFYGQIPNYNSGSGTVYVDTYIGAAFVDTKSVNFICNVTDANPVFSNFTYEDTNSKTVVLTGNNQKVIKGYSNVKATISTGNKAVAIKSATMKKYIYSDGNTSNEITFSSTNDVSATINKIQSGIFTVSATDSRNNSTVVTKQALETLTYNALAKKSISVLRDNGISERVILKFDGTIHLLNFGSITNSIKVCKYRYKPNGGSWTDYVNVEPNVTDKEFSFQSQIPGDTDEGFNVDQFYNFEVYVEDELTSVTFASILSSGTPNIAFHKNGISIMGKYDTTVGGDFQIRGKNPFAYSDNETVIGTFLGKPLYRKVINFGTLPNAATKTVSHFISYLDEVTDIKGTAKSVTYGTRIPFEFLGYSQQIQITNKDIQIDNKRDASTFTAYITLEYTKTKD